jgi:hypothetical protein
MWQIEYAAPRIHTRALGALLLTGVLIMGSTPGFSRGPRPETIEATAMGTGTQLGALVGALLSAIQPPAAPLQSASKETASESQALHAEASLWRRDLMANPQFLRDLGAVLRPGDSAIFAVLGDADAAVRVLRGYSGVLLRTSPRRQAYRIDFCHLPFFGSGRARVAQSSASQEF